jgi:hypothetical protein
MIQETCCTLKVVCTALLVPSLQRDTPVVQRFPKEFSTVIRKNLPKARYTITNAMRAGNEGKDIRTSQSTSFLSFVGRGTENPRESRTEMR